MASVVAVDTQEAAYSVAAVDLSEAGVVTEAGASLAARESAAPDRLNCQRFPVERVGAPRRFPAGLRLVLVGQEQAPAAGALPRFPPDLALAIALRSVASPVSGIDRA